MIAVELPLAGGRDSDDVDTVGAHASGAQRLMENDIAGNSDVLPMVAAIEMYFRRLAEGVVARWEPSMDLDVEFASL